MKNRHDPFFQTNKSSSCTKETSWKISLILNFQATCTSCFGFLESLERKKERKKVADMVLAKLCSSYYKYKMPGNHLSVSLINTAVFLVTN